MDRLCTVGPDSDDSSRMSVVPCVATFDVGTTAVKGSLVDANGHMVARASGAAMPMLIDGDRREQQPDDWWNSFLDVASQLIEHATATFQEFRVDWIVGIIMSGQMQDLIALDDDGRPVRPAILYSDGRAAQEAEELGDTFGRERFHALIGNPCEGSLPITKLMWLQRHETEAYARTVHVLFDAKDYLCLCLTGEYSGDVTACSTSGAMDIRRMCWAEAVIAAAGLRLSLLPRLHRPDDRIGVVTPDAAHRTGFAEGTPVYAGIGDAGATTLAAGVVRPGQYNINLGTSGWVASVSKEPIINQTGVANLAFTTADGYINGVPFLNAGDVHRWATRTFAGRSANRDDDASEYRTMASMLGASVPGSHGVLCLPYLVGERFPAMNASIRGAYVGLTPDTSAADLAHAALEGVALSLRQGLAMFDTPAQEVSLIGGGAQEPRWCQIMADVLGVEVDAFRDADVMPSVALASLVFANRPGRAMSWDADSNRGRMMRYTPDPSASAIYDKVYARFLRLYPAINAIG